MFKEKFKATFCHFAVTLLIATATGLTTFMVLYPDPYWKLSNGFEIWRLITIIEVFLGPLMSFVIYRSSKSRKELITDYSVVAMVQIAALAYGCHTLIAARPVALVFSADRFEVVTASDFTSHDMELPDSISHLGTIMRYGIELPEDKSTVEFVLEALETGKDNQLRPELYVPFTPAMADGKVYPLSTLCEHEPDMGWCKKETELFIWGIVSNNQVFWTGLFEKSTLQLLDISNLDPYILKAKVMDSDQNKTPTDRKGNSQNPADVE